MRVLAVTTWLPTQGAPSRGSFVVNNLRAIAAAHEVRVIHLVPPGDDDGTRATSLEGIPVRRIPMSTSRPDSIAHAARELRRVLASPSWRLQILHSMAISSLEPLALLAPEIAARHLPWVHTEHWSALTAPETLSAAGRAALPLLRKLLRLPGVVTTDSAFLARGVEAGRGTDRDTRVVPCIVEPYPPSPRRERCDGILRLVSVGGLIDRKDPLLAIEVVAELARRGVEAHLTWVGGGPLLEACEERAASLGLTDRVSLAGSRSPEGVKEALAQADLFLAPTKSDNFFVAVAEAIMAGRPVVTGAKGGQGEYLDPHYSHLVASRNPADWAQAIIDLDAQTAEVSAQQIAATIGDRFSTAAATARYNRAYRDAAAPSSGQWQGEGAAHVESESDWQQEVPHERD